MRPQLMAVIADDDKKTLRELVKVLEEENFEVALALDTAHAFQLILKHKPQLIISEVAKNNYDGLSLFEKVRSEVDSTDHQSKLIILTNNTDEKNEILSFETGIDSYLRKPLRTHAFKKRLARFFQIKSDINAIKMDHFQIKDLYFDLKKRLLYRKSSPTHLTIQAKTFDILFFLASNVNHVFSRQELLQQIWKDTHKVTARSVDVHILKIRQLLGNGYVKTIKGVGYLFKD